MKLSNKLFIKVELILIMLFIIGNTVLKLIPDKSNYGLAAVFSIEFLITIIAAFFTFFVYSAIIIVLLITIIYNIEQVYNRKDINKPIRYH